MFCYFDVMYDVGLKFGVEERRGAGRGGGRRRMLF